MTPEQIDEAIKHVQNGGQITTGTRWLMKVGDSFFHCCENEGCCDDYYSLDELKVAIRTDDWSILNDT